MIVLFIVPVFVVSQAFDPNAPVGKVLSNFELTNQDGKSVQLTDLLGKTVLLSFIFTRCPMPNMCPLITSKMAQVQKALQVGEKGQVVLASVTFDPAYDNAAVLKEYGSRYQADFSTWHFLTGDPAVIKQVTDQVSLLYEDMGEGMIGHNMKTLVIGPDGVVRQLYHGGGWSAQEVLQVIRKVSS